MVLGVYAWACVCFQYLVVKLSSHNWIGQNLGMPSLLIWLLGARRVLPLLCPPSCIPVWQHAHGS